MGKKLLFLVIIFVISFLLIGCSREEETIPEEAEETKKAEPDNVLAEAVLRDDIKICDKADEETKEKCRRNFIFVEAEKKNNPKICEKLSDADVEMCKNQVMLNNVMDNPDYCNSLEGEEKESCLAIYNELEASIGIGEIGEI